MPSMDPADHLAFLAAQTGAKFGARWTSGPNLQLGERTFRFPVAMEGRGERPGRGLGVGVRIGVELDGAPLPELTTRFVGLGRDLNEALAEAFAHWAVQVPAPIFAAYQAVLPPQAGVYRVDTDGYTLYCGVSSVRTEGSAGAVDFVQAVRAHLPTLEVGWHGLLLMRGQADDRGTVEARVDGAVDDALGQRVLALPADAGTWLAKQFVVARPR